MKALVLTDDADFARATQPLLTQSGFACSADDAVRLSDAIDHAALARVDLVVLGLSPDADMALSVMKELKHVTSARIIAVGPASDPQLILRVLREGAYHYVDETELDVEFRTVLQKASQERTEPPHGRVIVVMSSSGGAGASTVAVNIATALSQRHSSCGLFDLKLEAGDLTTLLNLKPAHTLADFCDNATRMDDSIFTRCFASQPNGVALLAAPREFDDIERVTPQGVRKALAMARKRFPYVVVDAGQGYRPEQTQAMIHSDAILMIVRPDIVSLRQAQRAMRRCSALGIAAERIKIVVNRCGRHSELRLSQVGEFLTIAPASALDDDPKNIRRANLAGVPLIVARPRAGVAREMQRLAMSVNGTHK